MKKFEFNGRVVQIGPARKTVLGGRVRYSRTICVDGKGWPEYFHPHQSRNIQEAVKFACDLLRTVVYHREETEITFTVPKYPSKDQQ